MVSLYKVYIIALYVQNFKRLAIIVKSMQVMQSRSNWKASLAQQNICFSVVAASCKKVRARASYSVFFVVVMSTDAQATDLTHYS